MTIDPQLMNAFFSGAVMLLGGLTGLLAARGRRAGVQRREHRELQRRLVAALGHVFRLEALLAGHGIDPPARPAALDTDDDENPPTAPVALPPPPRPAGGRHGE